MKKDTDWSMFQQYFCFYFSSEIVGKLLIANLRLLPLFGSEPIDGSRYGCLISW